MIKYNNFLRKVKILLVFYKYTSYNRIKLNFEKSTSKISYQAYLVFYCFSIENSMRTRNDLNYSIFNWKIMNLKYFYNVIEWIS